MEWLNRMNDAISYIESNINDKIDYNQVAKNACCSVYHFQRMFSFMTNTTLAEYIRRRRMTLAAFDLQSSNIKVVDLALKYGYDSPEAFTRAFQLLHGITPSQARKQGVAIKAYPRISFQITIKGDSEMNYKIEHKEAFEVYGIGRIFDTKEGENLRAIPAFWDEIIHNGEYDKLSSSTGKIEDEIGLCPVNSVCCYSDMDGTTFPYMICALKTDTSNTEGYEVVKVPSSTWAIFSNEPQPIENTSEATQTLNRRIYTDWLPTSNFEKLEGYEFEMYYYDGNNQYHEEIWIRVIPK